MPGGEEPDCSSRGGIVQHARFTDSLLAAQEEAGLSAFAAGFGRVIALL